MISVSMTRVVDDDYLHHSEEKCFTRSYGESCSEDNVHQQSCLDIIIIILSCAGSYYRGRSKSSWKKWKGLKFKRLIF